MTGFAEIVRAHREHYPLMEPQDYGKLAYQSALGPGHMIADEQEAAARIQAEWQAVSQSYTPVNPEPIGGGLCRFHLTADNRSVITAEDLARLFAQSAAQHTGTQAGLLAKLDVLMSLPVDGMAAWLEDYIRRGCPPVRHSEAYRRAYHPHYRVILETLLDPPDTRS